MKAKHVNHVNWERERESEEELIEEENYVEWVNENEKGKKGI